MMATCGQNSATMSNVPITWDRLVKLEENGEIGGIDEFEKTIHTPDEAKDELHSGVSLMLPVQTYGDGTLSYYHGSDVMKNSDRRKFRTKK